MDVIRLAGVIVILLGINVNCQLILTANPLDPVTASVFVQNQGAVTSTECRFQCRNNQGAWEDCQCQGRLCNTQCSSDTITNLVPGQINNIALNRRVDSTRWETFAVTVSMPFVDYALELVEVHRTTAIISVNPTTASGFVSNSCNITIAKAQEQIYRDASCAGSCSPCTRVTINNLDASTDYDVRIMPNYARRPEFIRISTSAFVFALEEVEIFENNATIRVVTGDAPRDATCDFLIRRTLDESFPWTIPRCNHNDNCPNRCDQLLVITELIADEEYELAMNSTVTSDQVTLKFKTGTVQYSGSVLSRGSTWIEVHITRINGSEVEDDRCDYFLNSIRFGRVRATCNGLQCPSDCKTSVNITSLVPGVQYRLIIVPWKHGSFFYVDFTTVDVRFSIRESRFFPTKVYLSLASNIEPRGVCSFRVLDSTNRYTIFGCEGGRCPTNCQDVNITGLSPYEYYELEVHSTYSSIIGTLFFRTTRVIYSITQASAAATSVSINLKADTDYTKDVFEDCSMVLQESTGERIHLTSCLFPPCGFRCSNNNYTITGLQAGKNYIFYLNSTLTNYEHYRGMYTVEVDISLIQIDATANSIKMSVSLNDTNTFGTCNIGLEDRDGRSITPSCEGGNCGSTCSDFTLVGLSDSSIYKLSLSSILRRQNISLEIYTLYPAPRIVKTEVSGKQSILVTWEYEFKTIKDFVFTVFATDTITGGLLFAHSYYPPSLSANMVFLPPSTRITINVCSAPFKADHLRSCNSAEEYIEVTEPDPLGAVQISFVDGRQVDITLPPITPFQGNVTKCLIYVVYLLNPNSYSTLTMPNARDVIRGGRFFVTSTATGILHAHFAGDECRRLSKFKIGDNVVYGGIKNGRVRAHNYLTILYRACISETICSDSSLPLPQYIGGISVAVYVILAVAFLTLISTLTVTIYRLFSKSMLMKIKVLNNDSTVSTLQQTPIASRQQTLSVSDI